MSAIKKFPDEYMSKDINTILNKIDKEKDIQVLKDVANYYLYLKENNALSKENSITLLKRLSDRIETLKNDNLNIDNVGEKFEEIKKDIPKLNHITLIEPSEYDNDKIDGSRKNTLYIKFKDNDILYEVTNINAVKNILFNTDLSELTENEIINELKSYSKECPALTVDERGENSLNSDKKTEEYKEISDAFTRNRFIMEENQVLKETVDIRNYVHDYMNDAEITFALNEQGERIYLIEDKTFKFVGDEDRVLKEIKQDGKEEENANVAEFNKDKSAGYKLKELNAENFNNLNDYLNAENELSYMIKAMSLNLGLTDNQIELITNFLRLGIDCKNIEELSFPSANLEILYDELYELLMTNSKYRNPVIDEILNIKENNNNRLSNEHVKKLEFNANDLTDGEKRGFVLVTIILESSLILGLIFSLLALVKK